MSLNTSYKFIIISYSLFNYFVYVIDDRLRLILINIKKEIYIDDRDVELNYLN